MNNKYLKIVMLFLILVIVGLFGNQSCVFAVDHEDSDLDSTEGVPKFTRDLIDAFDLTKANKDPTEGSNLVKIVAQIFSVIQFIGTGISIIMVMWVGITYMMSSVEQKAELKKRSVPIVTGSILIVSTVNVLKFIQLIITESL